MTELADVNEFIVQSRSVGTRADLLSLISGISGEMGFSYVSLFQHDRSRADDAQSQLAISNYPEVWRERIWTKSYHARDPVYLASQRTNVGFRLDEVASLITLTAVQRKILSESRMAGLGDGFAVPAHIPGETTGLATFLTKRGAAALPHRRPVVQVVGAFGYEAARRLMIAERGAPLQQRVSLSPRQVECVLLVARGKTDWEIASILGLSEETIGKYMEDARKRYDVAKRAQLVLRAMFDGHFSILDAF